MEELIPTSLGPVRRRALRRALDAEPALADELAMIVPQLSPARRARFWNAFGRACVEGAAGDERSSGGRPAGAALAALEQAALAPAGGSRGRGPEAGDES